MSKLKVEWLSLKDTVPAKGMWDQAFIGDLLDNVQNNQRQIVVIPGAYQFDIVPEINKHIAQYDKVLVIVTSDEENKFPTGELDHPDMLIYATYPGPNYKNVSQWLPIGYTPECRKILSKELPPNKVLSWYFAGQVTHPSRERLSNVLQTIQYPGEIQPTDGFAKGIDQTTYYYMLRKTRIAPAPGGPCSPDSFRLYEALEAGCIPVPENPGFFNQLFAGEPLYFNALSNWSELPDLMTKYNDHFYEVSNNIFAWWQWYKRKLLYKLREDSEADVEDLTVIVPTSYIPSHPSTKIIEETLDTIKSQLPDVEIVVTIDGLRDEHKKDPKIVKDYELYINKLLWLTNHKYSKTYPMLHREHFHQVEMAKRAMEHITSPIIMYAEHDTPITPDCDFDWPNLKKCILDGTSNMIRFHFEAHIPEAHKHMMLDDKPKLYNKVPLIRTAQWSQRPHLASSAYYRRVLSDHFTPDARSFIEDKLHSVVYTPYKDGGEMGWQQHRVHIYAPDGNIKRSYHTDGRAGTEKYDDRQIF